MRALGTKTWSTSEALALHELPTPEPRADELRVAVKAIGVNPVDWKMLQGGPMRLMMRALGPKPPVVVGVDFAGVVDAVGAGVTDLKPGDAVVGGTNFSRGQRGSYADTVLVRADQVCALPPGVDLDVAAALPVAGVTAWMSLVELGGLESGQRALVLGASGGVGQMCVQVAKHLRGAFVAGVCSAANAGLVRSLGADEVADYRGGDALTLAKAFGPFQVIVDCAGGYSAARCRALLTKKGRHVMVAGDSASSILQRLVPPFQSKGILAVTTRARLAPLVAAVAAGQLKIRIERVFPLAEAAAAHASSKEGRLTGKLVLRP